MAWWDKLLGRADARGSRSVAGRSPDGEAARLAGRAMAYAALNLSDMPEGALLTPFASVMRSGADPRHAREELVRFAGETQDEAIAAARAHVAAGSATSSGWALAREGTMRDADGAPQDVVVAEGWAPGLDRPLSLIQSFRAASGPGGFALLGPPILAIDGAPQTDDRARGLVEVAEEAALRLPGVERSWSRWRAAGTA